jgi:DNA adenine methylase
VPYGRPKTSNLINASNLLSCGLSLNRPGVSLAAKDFASAFTAIGPGDLVFLDPPYVTRHDDNGFIDYNEHLFSWKDQQTLAALAQHAANQGASVVVTNANHDDVVALYEGFNYTELRRESTLASNPKKRGSIREAILWRIAKEDG